MADLSEKNFRIRDCIVRDGNCVGRDASTVGDRLNSRAATPRSVTGIPSQLLRGGSYFPCVANDECRDEWTF
jgi:hypothetical protein